MKNLKNILFLVITLLIVASCSNKTVNRELEYTVSGCFVSDSLPFALGEDSIINLYIDKHSEFLTTEIPVKDGKFEYVGSTSELDELFLGDNDGGTINLFATGNSHISLEIENDSMVSFTEQDSLNIKYYQIIGSLDTIKEKRREKLLDSICVNCNNSLLPLLVMRDRMCLIADSVFLRKCLGKLGTDSIPAWLMNAIEQNFDRPAIQLKRNIRLSPLPKFRTEIDSIVFDMKESRQNSAYIYFWAEYSDESVDSLQMLPKIAKKYGLYDHFKTFKGKDNKHMPKRIDLVTICLFAKDSTSWRKAIEGLPGQHVLLQDGFSNPIIKSWNINKVPYNILIDRFSNVQDSYQWGKGLQSALERMPNNFTSQNGSSNNISRASRH